MSGMQGLRLAAVSLAAATCVLLAVGILQVLGLVDSINADEIPLWIVPFILAALLVPTAVGLAIALRQPRNVIAWILLVGAFAIVAFTGRDTDGVAGTVFEVTADELQRADRYEVAAYRRVSVTLRSGRQAWVYVDARLAPPA